MSIAKYGAYVLAGILHLKELRNNALQHPGLPFAFRESKVSSIFAYNGCNHATVTVGQQGWSACGRTAMQRFGTPFASCAQPLTNGGMANAKCARNVDVSPSGIVKFKGTQTTSLANGGLKGHMQS
jgi:hypothetical protein